MHNHCIQHTFWILFTIVFLGLGCVRPPIQEEANDFEPIHGASTTPTGITASKEGPFARRIMTAVSMDGHSYVQNGGWIADQAYAPDAVISQDGTIYVYYTGWIVGDRLNTSAVALSTDAGKTWTYKYLELLNSGPIDRVVDPDVILLEDGTFRLFFTAGNPQGVHYAEGSDGISFTYKGLVFGQNSDVATDPTTFKMEDVWHMYARSEDGAYRLWHLTSTDGVYFEMYALTTFPVDQKPFLPAGEIHIGDRVYLFLFEENGDVRSVWSKNGFDWYPEEGTSIEPSGEESFIEDPTVIQMTDGQYLMFYVTNIP